MLLIFIFFESLSSEKNFLTVLSLIEIRPEDEEWQEGTLSSFRILFVGTFSELVALD